MGPRKALYQLYSANYTYRRPLWGDSSAPLQLRPSHQPRAFSLVRHSARSALQAALRPVRYVSVGGVLKDGSLRPLKACFSMGRASLRDSSIPAPKGWLSEEPSPFRIPKHVQGAVAQGSVPQAL